MHDLSIAAHAQLDAGPRQVVRVHAPVQVDVPEGMPASDAQALVSSSGLSLPLLVKPMWTDGREGSHGLAIVTDYPSLRRLLEGGCSSSFRPPVVVQEYVEHGGVLHKVYVLGDTSVVCRRPSLSDKYLGQRHGVLQLPRISCKTVRPDFHGSGSAAAAMELGHSSGGLGTEACMSPSPSSYDVTLDSESEAQMTPSSSRPSSPYDAAGAGMLSPSHGRPPDWVTQALAKELRARLGMELFNFDLIVPTDEVPASAGIEGDARSDSDGSSSVVFYVVDINYFPGVDKIPNFEQVFLGFLRSACLDS
uniref:Inositol-tetrakisphosphate 1-kinase n=1 Tax=Chlamydomonas euryale TaxID=1486919 RepID=A0A6U2JB51_9CHLO|mmetsp:Transcript_5679/g.17318  ORF Transcript_5679/g.17318 Transcript_5679/m.17318 type:complete len:306 (+) Transcript_5679:78-995(+)